MLPQIVGTSTGHLNQNTGQAEGTFTVYLIRWGEGEEVRRRYSEFELLRSYLQRSHPFVICPPIPEKEARGRQWLKVLGGKADAQQVQYRVRMLESFLQHAVQSYPEDRGLQAFLSGAHDWVMLIVTCVECTLLGGAT